MAQWYVIRGDQERGPFDDSQLKELASSGKLKTDHLIRRDGSQRKCLAKNVKGLFPTSSAKTHAETAPEFLQNAKTNSNEKDVDSENGPIPLSAEIPNKGQGDSSTLETVNQREQIWPEGLFRRANHESTIPHEQWFFIKDGSQSQPVSFVAIHKMFVNGNLSSEDTVGRQDMLWVKAGDVLTLSPEIEPTVDDRWFYLANDQRNGPISFAQLEELAKRNEISPLQQISRAGSKWIQANRVLAPKNFGVIPTIFNTLRPMPLTKMLLTIGAFLLLWKISYSLLTQSTVLSDVFNSNADVVKMLESAKPGEIVFDFFLMSEYNSSPVAADLKYKGRHIIVAGFVHGIEKDVSGTYHVEFYERANGTHIKCFVTTSQQKALADLSQGEWVRIRGTCNGRESYGRDVELTNCSFIKFDRLKE